MAASILRRAALGTVGLCGAGAASYVFLVQPPRTKPELAGKRAVVKCKCGQTGLSFRNSEPVLRVECCCFDCRQRWDWQRARGAHLQPYATPIQALYMHNAITHVEGEHLLGAWQLRDSGPAGRIQTHIHVTALSCESCKTILAVTHPVYFGNVVAISPDRERTTCAEIPCSARINTKDWDEEVVGREKWISLPEYSGGGPTIDGRNLLSTTYKLMFETGMPLAVLGKPLRLAGDRTLEDVIAKAGKIQIVGVKEYAHLECQHPVNLRAECSPLPD